MLPEVSRSDRGVLARLAIHAVSEDIRHGEWTDGPRFKNG